MQALVDAHCHLDFPAFTGRLDAVLARARAAGVSQCVIPGVRRADWARVRSVSEGHDGLWYCLGIHPWFVDEHDEADLQALEQAVLARDSRCVAVGECGLDRLHGSLDAQQPWFDRQVALARDGDLPLVIHSVRTHDEVAATLRRFRWRGRALVHGFSGSVQQAQRLVKLGCCIGVGGVITHPRATRTRAAIKAIPEHALVLETDAPDMAPAGVAAGENAPEYLRQILSVLAELRATSPDQLAPVLYDNTRRLFGWSGS